MTMPLSTTVLAPVLALVAWLIYWLVVEPLKSPLRNLPGPDARLGLGLGGHLEKVMR